MSPNPNGCTTTARSVSSPPSAHRTWVFRFTTMARGKSSACTKGSWRTGCSTGWTTVHRTATPTSRSWKMASCELASSASAHSRRDIHGFQARDDDTWMIAVVHGEFAEERLYFEPEKKSYVRRH